MKNKIWLLQIPFILFFTLLFCLTEFSANGSLENKFIREKIFPSLRSLSGMFTNLKFKIRGPREPKNKIVIIEIDGPALDELGRWPWHRDITAKLIQKTFDAGAKVVGLDMTFSEPDQRIPKDLGTILKEHKMENLLELFETDPMLVSTIEKNADHLVVGWATEALCLPKFSGKEDCPVTLPEAIATLPPDFAKFSIDPFHVDPNFDPQNTDIPSAPTVMANIPLFSAAAKHAGSFGAYVDPDGYVRRTALITMVNGKPQPSLALEMARLGLAEKISLSLDKNHLVENLKFMNSGRTIPVNPLGIMEINFHGPSRTYPYIAAMDMFSDKDVLEDPVNHKFTGMKKADLLKDAYVLIGISAVGVFDMRAFPFGSNVAGVEGHANILDNLLFNDSMYSASTTSLGFYGMLLLMTLGALLFAYFSEQFESVQALVLFFSVAGVLGILDTQVLFKNNYNWNTGFLLIELCCIFITTISAKYILEENNKKFIKGAFAKYVAPSIVDSILKDPTKLSLGGERRELTIMFSDIRGFTSFSERMDAKSLAAFLNDYLGIMTKLVFAHEGTLDKYIGDAVMAFWGAPLDQEKHAYNAVITAIAMMKALEENRARFKSQYDVEVNIGIGINSGLVSVGNMGSENNFEYTVIGDHVNLASRLEGLTKAYGASIVTTRFTMDLIQKSGAQVPAHRTLDFVKVKGKKNAVELIQVFDHEYLDEALKIFDSARQLYQTQKWDEAIALFEKSNSLLGQDEPSLMYIERCHEFKKSPPAQDWDGAWEMHSK